MKLRDVFNFRSKQEPTIKPNCQAPDYHDVTGGFWGNKIDIMGFEPDNYSIVGWKPFDQRLSLGDVIMVDCQKSYMWFYITEIKYFRDPNDMFSAKMKPFHQEMKPFEFPSSAGTAKANAA